MATESRICSLALVTMLAEIFDGFFHWLDLGGVLPEYSFLAIGVFFASSGEDSDSSELDRNGDGCFEGVRGMNLIWFLLSLNRTPVEGLPSFSDVVELSFEEAKLPPSSSEL